MNLNSKSKLKSLFISNRGSSSVLVILIMVMLVVLGLLALMSTWADLKLARKNASWSKAYYSLDSKAEFRLAEIDACLLDADESAGTYMLTKDYERPESIYLPVSFQQVVHERWQTAQSSGDESEFVDSLYEKLYYAYSVIGLKELTNSELEVESELDFDNDTVKVYTTVHEDLPEDGRSILLGITLQSRSSGSESGSERYRIISWKELPKSFEYEDALDFDEMEFGEMEFGEMDIEDLEIDKLEVE